MSSAPQPNTIIRLETSLGNIDLEMNDTKAPNTVANFKQYVQDGHFNGTLFHRVIDGFMIQGGGFDENMQQKPTRAPIQNEAGNGLKNENGTIAMARTNDPHSASCQFFINVKDNHFLDHTAKTPEGWGYAVFGKVCDGMDVVEKIAKVETGSKGHHRDVPLEAVVITQATIITPE